jgi:hypothetical protein
MGMERGCGGRGPGNKAAGRGVRMMAKTRTLRVRDAVADVSFRKFGGRWQQLQRGSLVPVAPVAVSYLGGDAVWAVASKPANTQAEHGGGGRTGQLGSVRGGRRRARGREGELRVRVRREVLQLGCLRRHVHLHRHIACLRVSLRPRRDTLTIAKGNMVSPIMFASSSSLPLLLHAVGGVAAAHPTPQLTCGGPRGSR